MRKNSSGNDKIDNLQEQLGSIGVSFPQSPRQLEIFNKLHKNYKHELSPTSIDPSKIYNDEITKSNVSLLSSTESSTDKFKLKKNIEGWRMAARKSNSKLPDDILEKMKKNHEKKSKGDSSS